jgi:hypothetical protein
VAVGGDARLGGGGVRSGCLNGGTVAGPSPRYAGPPTPCRRYFGVTTAQEPPSGAPFGPPECFAVLVKGASSGRNFRGQDCAAVVEVAVRCGGLALRRADQTQPGCSWQFLAHVMLGHCEWATAIDCDLNHRCAVLPSEIPAGASILDQDREAFVRSERGPRRGLLSRRHAEVSAAGGGGPRLRGEEPATVPPSRQPLRTPPPPSHASSPTATVQSRVSADRHRSVTRLRRSLSSSHASPPTATFNTDIPARHTPPVATTPPQNHPGA